MNYYSFFLWHGKAEKGLVSHFVCLLDHSEFPTNLENSGQAGQVIKQAPRHMLQSAR